MPKRRGPIFLDKEVGRPGERVPRNQRQGEQPPFSNRDERDHTGNRRQRAKAMQQARCRLAVLAQVKRPEVGKRIELAIGHAKFSGDILAEIGFEAGGAVEFTSQ